jgi:predicted transposase YdaD
MALTYDLKNDIRFKEGKLEGKQEGKLEGIEVTIAVINLLNSNLSTKKIAEKLKISLDVVEKIAKSLEK